MPPHIRDVHFDFNAKLWEPEDIDKLGDLLCKFEHRFSKGGSDLGRVTVDPFRIILKPGAQPVRQRPYRYSPVMNEKVQIEIDKLLLAGVLRRSYSNWASPLVVVAKANGGVRLTVNYKRINKMSVIPKLPIPIVEDILAELDKSKIFSTLDLVSGFFQCSIEEDSIPITAVITSTGLYEFLSVPQGLSSSPGWFHSVMARVCDGLERVRLFIDDVIVFSRDGAEHVRDLERFFERMVKFNLKLAPKKTNLGVKVVTFLGHQVTAEGIGPDPGKVRPMREVPMPTNVSQLRSLLGSLSYYRKFLKNMSAKLKPINAMLKKGAKFAFTADHVAVVRKMMDILSGPEVLAFPCYEGAISGERPFRLTADASISGLGAVIEQEQRDGSIRPLCFLSRSTFPNETRWSPTELEAGAIVWAIKKNRTLFYGIPFEVYSDHQPLRNLGSLAEKNNRVQRWYDFLSAYTYELKYRPGRENANADMMSRLPLPATKEDEAPDVRLTDPSDLDVYMIGASGVLPSRLGPVYTEREALAGSNHRDDFVVGESGCTSARLTTDELADKTWALIQRGKGVSNPLPDGACVPDDTRLVEPSGEVVSGQFEPGLILHAVP